MIYLGEYGGLSPKFSRHFFETTVVYFVLCRPALAKLHFREARKSLGLVKARLFWSTPVVLEVSDNPRLRFVTGGWIIHWKLLIGWETATGSGKRLSGVIRALFTLDCRITQGRIGLKWITDTNSARPEGAAINALITRSHRGPRVNTRDLVALH